MENYEFPGMEKIKSAPTLFSINGFGFRIYGNRDEHPETKSYVATHFLTALYIPVIALGAYRIVETEEGSYFLGKEKLSNFAKNFNYLILSLILTVIGAIGWQEHVNSDNYKAGKDMEKAEAAMAENKIGGAAVFYKLVFATRNNKYAEDAGRQLGKIITPESLKSAERMEAVRAVEIVASIRQFQPALFKSSLELLEFFVDENDPRLALRIFDAVSGFAPDKSVIEEKRFQLLEKIVESEPNDHRHAIELALIYESRGDFKTCESLLSPHKSILKGTEGARILGQIYAYQNKIQESYDLLVPYTREKLKLFHAKEEAYNLMLDSLWEKILDDLNSGKGPKSFYNKYDLADKERKNELVQDYYAQQMKKSPEIAAKLKELRECAKIVPVALDMGIVILMRAQGLTDEAERTRELEAAQETFLAIKGVAGESDEYRLYLGQVYYWLGKMEEGRALFEKLLADKNRDFNTLHSVSSILRDVGENSGSKKLAIESYEKAGKDKERYMAAQFISLLSDSLEEKIEWLNKSDPENLHVKAQLNVTRGLGAQRLNKMNEAAGFFKKAIDIYKQLPETSSNLNNAALVYFNQYNVTGDKKTMETGIAKMDEAIALDPGQSIILMNASSILVSTACGDVIGDRINLSLMKMSGGINHFKFLYNDEKQKNEFASQFMGHPAIVKALSYTEKAILLAPKNSQPYTLANSIYSFVKSEKGLSSLSSKLRDSSLDLENDIESRKEILSGEKDAYYQETYAGKLAECKELLSKIDPEKQEATQVALVSNMISIKANLMFFSGQVDYNELVAMAEKNYKHLPSFATRNELISSLLSRSLDDLSKKNPGLMDLKTKYRRSFSDRYLIAIALDSPELKDRILASKDFKRAVELIEQHITDFPADCGVNAWAILRHASPEHAVEVSQIIANNPLNDMNIAIDEKLWPYEESNVYERYWKELLHGRDQNGIKLVREAIDSGMNVPMPL